MMGKFNLGSSDCSTSHVIPARGQSMFVLPVWNVFAASAGRTAGLKAARLAGLCGKNTIVQPVLLKGNGGR